MSNKSLILYHYFERDDTYRDNFQYFLEHAILPSLEYIVCINGGCSLNLPLWPNIRYLHRPNEGFDFGAYDYAINTLDIDGYKYFFFISCAVRGPFLPPYFIDPWTVPFLKMLSHEVKLVGPSINILHRNSAYAACFRERHSFREPYSHVQTMMFATDHDCIAFLKNKGFFDRGIEPTPGDVILNHEILLSQEVLSNGWNISSILPAYRALDYRNIADDINPSSYQGDPWFPGAYFRRSIHPLETIFFKTNRGIMGATELEYLGDLFHPPKISDPSTKFNPLEATLAGIASAWKGHKNFAIWLTSRLKANTIVDLGVDFGYSTFCFAAACAGEVYAIDSFEGDEQTGFRNTFQEVSRTRERLGLWNVNIVHGYFDAVAGSWNRSIDILHIDGKHTYEAAKEDYLTWSKFVKPSGAVLLHDTCVPHFGVRQLLHEIALPKVNFSHSHGLGVVSQDRSLVLEIARTFESLIEPRSLQPRILDFLRAWRARKSPKPLDLR